LDDNIVGLTEREDGWDEITLEKDVGGLRLREDQDDLKSGVEGLPFLVRGLQNMF
jgi:hypothetical protein